jgi:hypothetical protein
MERRLHAAALVGWTVMCVGGLAALLVGLGMAWRPAAWICGGLVLMVTGFGGYRQQLTAGRNGRRG